MNERAFPLQSAAAHNGQYGMTLRDYFAAQAITGFLSQAGWGADIFGSLNRGEKGMAITTAQFAYAIADAMLAERSK